MKNDIIFCLFLFDFIRIIRIWTNLQNLIEQDLIA